MLHAPALTEDCSYTSLDIDMVARKSVTSGEEAVSSFLAAKTLEASRSLKKLGRLPSAFEIKVYKVTLVSRSQCTERKGCGAAPVELILLIAMLYHV